MAAAGTNTHGKSGGTARECLAFEQRPRTPPEIGRFRKSTTLALEKRYLHHGSAADYQAMNLGELTFGEKGERGDNTAADLLNHSKLTELEQINMEKSERIYRQKAMEPLGRSVDRHTTLPDKHTTGRWWRKCCETMAVRKYCARMTHLTLFPLCPCLPLYSFPHR